MSTAPHLDDDALSAHLDGLEAGAAAAADAGAAAAADAGAATAAGGHVAVCADCRARLDLLAHAAASIGTPPPMPSARVVDDAVARVLDAEARGARRPVLVALAAAALVVLGVAGVAFVGDDEPPSESDTAALTDAESGADDSGAGATSDSAVAFGGDLGALDDPKALADRVRAVVEPPTTAAAGGAPTTSTMPVPPASRTAGADTRSLGPKDPYCERAVAEEFDEGLGPLVYRAVLTWDGTAAVALVYELDDSNGELDHRLYVLASGSCQLLVAQTF